MSFILLLDKSKKVKKRFELRELQIDLQPISVILFFCKLMYDNLQTHLHNLYIWCRIYHFI
jgi:hypothetical protein